MDNLDEAIKQHEQWRDMFLAMLNSENLTDITTGRVLSSYECSLGKWIDSDDANQYSGNPNYQKLIQSHKDFHTKAAIIVSLVKDNNLAQALEVKAEFLKNSNDITRSLELLKTLS